MKRIVLGLLALLIIIPLGAWLYFVTVVKIHLKPVSGGEATVPLALARVEMNVPASWRVAFYRTEIVFDRKSTPAGASREAAINELDLDGAYDPKGDFNPDLFSTQESRSRSYEEHTQLKAPEGLGRPFKGRALVNKFDKRINYVAAMDMGGFLLQISLGQAWPEGVPALSPDDHDKLFAEHLSRLFEIYEPKPELRETTDLRTRFGRVRQNPDDYFINQTISIRSPEEDFNFGAAIWTKGDCGRDQQYQGCAGLNQFFEPYQEHDSAASHLINLASGYYQKTLESGQRKINGLDAHAGVFIRYNVFPWGFDGEWDSLITSLRIYAGPAVDNTGDVLMTISSEDMEGRGDLEEHFSRHYGLLTDIWSSVRPIR